MKTGQTPSVSRGIETRRTALTSPDCIRDERIEIA
jgi:hypothetical protein